MNEIKNEKQDEFTITEKESNNFSFLEIVVLICIIGLAYTKNFL